MAQARPPSGEVRPRLTVIVDASSAAVLEALRRYLEATEFGCRGWVAPPYAELEVRAATKHFWSPRLAICATDEDDRCHLHGRFQPEPNVWTMFMAGWGMLAVLGAVSIAWACAYTMLGRSLTGPLVGCGLALALAVVLYLSALSGQRLGADQMEELRDALFEALDRAGLSRTLQ